MALERIVDAVEKLTKAKHVVGNTLNILQFPSQSPVNIFSRLSGGSSWGEKVSENCPFSHAAVVVGEREARVGNEKKKEK